jgi:pSer/pThr/pTyr-binding forkhead associated (FHA) protein
MPASTATIVALHADIQPARYPLLSEGCVIGRADLCHLVIPDEIVSHIHALIEQDETGHYVLRDSHSANGTYVNGVRLQSPYVLKNQDEIGLGTPAARLRFEITPQFPPK